MKKISQLFDEFIEQPLCIFNRGIGWVTSRTFKKQHLCIACFPKSGSTYLARTLEKVLNYKFIHYANMGNSEHDVVEPFLIQNLHHNTVTHLHMTATDSNVFNLHYYKIMPIIQVRNVFDCVISLRDHIVEESIVWPMAVVEHSFNDWEISKQYDFIIANFLPWYIKFYVSWFRVSEKSELPIYWIQYEELMKNKLNVIEDMLLHFKIPFDRMNLLQVLNEQATNLKKGDFRLNVGVQGRGVSNLSKHQIERIKNYASFYSTVDFSRIGL